jgi:hypothetical protein
MDGDKLTARIETLKKEHDVTEVTMIPSPDGLIHLGVRKQANTVDVWLPWDLFDKAMAPPDPEAPKEETPDMAEEKKEDCSPES